MKKLLALLLAVLPSCGTPEMVGSEGGEAVSEDGLSSTRETFVRIRRDYRRCVSPLCGGYWATDLNSSMQERYVSGLDFSGAVLDDGVQADVVNAGEGEVVLFGRLGPLEKRFNTRPFMVFEAYRGMPGVKVADGDTFYSVLPTKIACIRAPCPTLSVTRLNRSTGSLMAGDVNVDGALKQLVDGNWLKNRVMTNRAVVAAKIGKNGLEEPVVQASQVFVQLPDRIQGCPKVAVPTCADNKILAWARTENRCTIPVGCVFPGVCAPFEPTCDEGYTRLMVSNICPRVSCEPTFLDD